MTTHFLKTHPAMFRAIKDGSKTFEVRKDDRAFQKGDTVVFEFYDPELPVPPLLPPGAAPSSDHHSIRKVVGFVLRGGQYGVEPGHVVFSLSDEPSNEAHGPEFNGMGGKSSADTYPVFGDPRKIDHLGSLASLLGGLKERPDYVMSRQEINVLLADVTAARDERDRLRAALKSVQRVAASMNGFSATVIVDTVKAALKD